MDGVADGGGIGRPVRRLEDLQFLIGKGRYSDDSNVPNQAHALMVRSPHAHARRIHSIDIRTAQRAPGTLAVLTGRDFLADGVIPVTSWQKSCVSTTLLPLMRPRSAGAEGSAEIACPTRSYV
jgi:CO/xanthine dehydrogenase Mo-binding subunit